MTAVHGVEVCGFGDLVPGVVAPMDSPEGVQACNECNLYGSDLDAALALAVLVPNAIVRFTTDRHVDETYDGTPTGSMIAGGTNPWVEVAGTPVDWLRPPAPFA